LEIDRVDPEVRERQIERLKRIKKERNEGRVAQSLEELARAASGNENIFLYLFEPLKAQATVDEIITPLKQVYGEFKEPVTV
jgi:methylmalonyl-CoA mutase N-terminal domain/subunit